MKLISKKISSSNSSKTGGQRMCLYVRARKMTRAIKQSRSIIIISIVEQRT